MRKVTTAKMVNRSWWTYALRGIVAMLLGVVTLIWTDITRRVLAVVIGALALVDGVTAIAAAVTNRAGGCRRWLVLEGITGLVVGTATLARPAITTLLLLYPIAVWAILGGMLQILAAIELRNVMEERGWFVVSGILSAVAGGVLASQPVSGALVSLIGIFAILFGTLMLLLAFRLRDAGNHVRNTNEDE